jgi:LysR family nitrogen assimilation transcriptional regulator
MDMRQLKYFLKVADLGSISKASDQLHVAQSAISTQIAALESELHNQLFLRRSTGVTLTEPGRLLYRHARLIQRQAEIAQEDVANASADPCGTVCLGLPSAMAELLGIAMIRACHEHLPLVRLQIVEGLSVLLQEFTLSGRLDMSILFLDHAPRGLEIQTVLDEELFFVCPPNSPFLDKRQTSISLEEALGTKLVMPAVGNSMRLVVDTACTIAGLSFKPVAELDSLTLLKACVVQNIASTFLPWAVVAKEEAAGDVQVLKVRAPQFTRPLSVCTSSLNASSAATDAVYKLLRDVMTDLVKDRIWQGTSLRTLSGS